MNDNPLKDLFDSPDVTQEGIQAGKPKQFNEADFQNWYVKHATKWGLNPNPDDPKHHYNYRAAYEAGVEPDQSGHWPSQFKDPHHPNRFVDGIDTVTGSPIKKPDDNPLTALFAQPQQPSPQMIEPEEEGQWEGWVKPAMKEIGRGATVGAGETAMALASPFITWPAAKLSGLVHSIWGGEAARAAEEDVMATGYQPITPEAQKSVELVAKLFHYGLWPARKAGEELTKMGYSRLGYYLETAGELAEFGLMGAAGKAVKPKGGPIKAKGVGRHPTAEALEAVKEPRHRALRPTAERPLGELVKRETKIDADILKKVVEKIEEMEPKPKELVKKKLSELSDHALKAEIKKRTGQEKEAAQVELKGRMAPTKALEVSKIPPRIKEKPKEVGKVAKEPWEMSRGKYADAVYDEIMEIGPATQLKHANKVHLAAVQQAIKEGKITSHPDYPELGKKAKKVRKPFVQKRTPNTLIGWIDATGGIREKTLPGEMQDLFWTRDARGKKVRVKGFPRTILNNKRGRGLDEIVDEAKSAGFDVKNVDHLIELMEKDRQGLVSRREKDRVHTVRKAQEMVDEMTDEEYYGQLTEHYKNEKGQEGLTKNEYADFERSVGRTTKGKIAKEVAKEAEFNRLSDQIVQDEYSKLSEEVKPTQATLIKKEAPFVLKGEEPPPKLVGKELTIYRGEGAYQKGDRYYSPDKEWTRQFTQSGRDQEIKVATIPTDRIYKPKKLPRATSETEFDAAIKEAKEKGYGAVWFDEGPRQPNSVYVIDKNILHKPKKAVIPTEKIPTATKGEQVSLIKKKGEQVTIGEKIEEVGKKAPSTTLEFFPGFQKMYEAWAKRMKARKAKEREPKIDVRVFDTGKIVKQRKFLVEVDEPTNTLFGKRRLKKRISAKAPPIYEGEAKVLRKIPDLPKEFLDYKLQNPPRVFDQLGPDYKELFYRPILEGRDRVARGNEIFQNKIKQLRKGVPFKSNKRLQIYAIAQQYGGKARLAAQGIKEIPRLTGKERAIYHEGERIYRTLYLRLNEARRLSGKAPFPSVKHYAPFIHDLGLIDQMGFNPIFDKPMIINELFLKLKTTPFRHAKPRAEFVPQKLNLDYFDVMQRYGYSAINHIQMSPSIAKLREYMLTFGKDKWKMIDHAPQTAEWLNAWINFQAGQTPFRLPAVLERGLRKLNKNALYAILSWNARSALIQPSAMLQAYVMLGEKYTAYGIESLLHPSKRNFALEKSKHLKSRDFDVAYKDAFDLIKGGKIMEGQKTVGKLGLKLLKILDMETAKATWQGAYQKATKELKYTEAKAIQYADDITIKTQASGAPQDVAPIQRTVLGKTATLFQTFVINEWNFMIKDVLGYKKAEVSKAQAGKNIIRFLIGTTLINAFYEDVLGLNSPYPSPINAYQYAKEQGKEPLELTWAVIRELVEKVPIIGGARYRGSIAGASLEAVGKVVKGQKLPETVGTLIGVPGTIQAGKTLRARKRGESLYGQIVGAYTKDKNKLRKPEYIGFTPFNALREF